MTTTCCWPNFGPDGGKKNTAIAFNIIITLTCTLITWYAQVVRMVTTMMLTTTTTATTTTYKFYIAAQGVYFT